MVYIVSEKIHRLLGQIAPLVEQYLGVEKEIAENVRQLAERIGHGRAIWHGLPAPIPVRNLLLRILLFEGLADMFHRSSLRTISKPPMMM